MSFNQVLCLLAHLTLLDRISMRGFFYTRDEDNEHHPAGFPSKLIHAIPDVTS